MKNRLTIRQVTNRKILAMQLYLLFWMWLTGRFFPLSGTNSAAVEVPRLSTTAAVANWVEVTNYRWKWYVRPGLQVDFARPIRGASILCAGGFVNRNGFNCIEGFWKRLQATLFCKGSLLCHGSVSPLQMCGAYVKFIFFRFIFYFILMQNCKRN